MRLGRGIVVEHRLLSALDDWFARAVGWERILSWANAHTPAGPRSAAYLATITKGVLDPLARGLLTTYGDDEDVADTLTLAFLASMTEESDAQEARRIALAMKFSSNEPKRIRGWAAQVVLTIDQELERIEASIG
jgi:hypothetical protein